MRYSVFSKFPQNFIPLRATLDVIYEKNFTNILSCKYFSLLRSKIELERVEDDGRRLLMSFPFKAKLDGEKYEFRLKAYEKNGSIDWCILVTSKNYIPENAVLLLNLSNNEVV